jgi:putative Holliday junction resolvase
MKRVLGVDLGKVRIGVAVLDWETGITTPRPPLMAKGALVKDSEQVLELAGKEEVSHIALGLPLLEGEEGKMAGVVRRFGEILIQSGIDVVFVDEALSSAEADTVMFEAGMKASQRKKRIDSESACIILDRMWGEREI